MAGDHRRQAPVTAILLQKPTRRATPATDPQTQTHPFEVASRDSAYIKLHKASIMARASMARGLGKPRETGSTTTARTGVSTRPLNPRSINPIRNV